MMIIIEYAENGDLLTYLKYRNPILEDDRIYMNVGRWGCPEINMRPSPKKMGSLGNKETINIACQIAKGMNHLAEMKV